MIRYPVCRSKVRQLDYCFLVPERGSLGTRLAYTSLVPRPRFYEWAWVYKASFWDAIFEFGHGFYGDTDISVLSDLTLTPGRLQILCS